MRARWRGWAARPGWWIGLGLVVGLSWLVSPAWAGETSLTLDEYWRKLADTRALAAQLAERPLTEARPALQAAAADWAAIRAVTLADGTRLPIETGDLAALLDADPPDFDYIERHLAAQLAARDVWPPARHSARALTPLQAILARPEFQWAATQPNPLLAWLQDLLQRWWVWVAQWLPADGVPALQYAVPIAAALGLILVLVYILRGLGGGFAADAQLLQPNEADPLTSEAALTRAQQFSGAGDYRAAVRFQYLAALLKLDERGLLRYERALTNREYLRRLADRPQLAAGLGPVVEVFDRVWYGFEPLDAQAYARYEHSVAALEALT